MQVALITVIKSVYFAVVDEAIRNLNTVIKMDINDWRVF